MTGHADEIGLMVTAIREDGMLSVCNIGGIYTATYPGHKVRVLTKKGMRYGAVLITRDLMKKADLSPHDLIIDIGASNREEAQKEVSVGDRIVFDTDYRELLHERITGRALDDRLGAFIGHGSIEKGEGKGMQSWRIRGSHSGRRNLHEWRIFCQSAGKAHHGHRGGRDLCQRLCRNQCCRYGGCGDRKGTCFMRQPDPSSGDQPAFGGSGKSVRHVRSVGDGHGRTGTDGDVMHKSGEGVPVALVSIPLRYMHSPAEVASLNDVQDCIELLAEFVCGLDETISLNPFV